MRLEKVALDKLLGVNRNAAEIADGISPERLYNLTSHRDGGYTPLGREKAAAEVSLGSRTLLDHDLTGLTSFRNGSQYSLSDGSSLYDGTINYSAGSLNESIHIPGAGAYKNRGQFLVLDKNNNKVEPFPLEITAAASSSVGVTEITLVPDTSAYTDAAYGDGRFLACDVLGNLSESEDGLSWSAITPTGDSIVGAKSIAYGAGRYVIVTVGGKILSSSDGVSFTQHVNEPTRTFYKVLWTGTRFVATYAGNDSNPANLGSLYISDDGINWVRIVSESNIPLYDVAFDGSTGLLAVGDYEEVGGSDSNVFTYSSDGGSTWLHVRRPLGDSLIRGVGHNGTNLWVIVGSYGSQGVSWTSVDGQNFSNRTYHPSVSTLTDVHWTGTTWVACGNGGILKSSDGINWTMVATYVGDLRRIVSDNLGNALVLGNFSYYLDYGQNLESGLYEVTTVTYVVCKTGKLVTEIKEFPFAFASDFANSIRVNVNSLATPYAGNVYVDVYVKFAPRKVVDEATGETEQEPLDGRDAVRVKTLKPGDSEAINTPPSIGQTLGIEGGILVVAVGGGKASVHANRAFYRLSSDLSEYQSTVDNADLDIGALSSPFALAYSERGYLNLISVAGYLTLPASQSSTLVSHISTPSGLLVFCDNETFLVSGDSDLSSLALELYPDIIGSDPGTNPTKLGGTPFVIWKGRLYAVAGGQVQEIARPLDLTTDPIVDVTADQNRASLVVKTNSGELFRYEVTRGFWSNDVVATADNVIGHPTGVRYLKGEPGAKGFKILETAGVTTPEIIWRGLDLGDAKRRDTLQEVRLTVTGYTVDTGNRPRLYYTSDSSLDLSSSFAVGYQFDDVVLFRLPPGQKGRRFDLRLVMNNMTASSVMEPGIELGFVPGHNREGK